MRCVARTQTDSVIYVFSRALASIDPNPNSKLVGATFKIEGYSTLEHSRPATSRRCLSSLASRPVTFLPASGTMQPSHTCEGDKCCPCTCSLRLVSVFLSIFSSQNSAEGSSTDREVERLGDYRRYSCISWLVHRLELP